MEALYPGTRAFMSCEQKGSRGAVWHLPSAHPPTLESRPGCTLLPASTLAPRSLSHSELLVPSTRLMPLAKEKNPGCWGRGVGAVVRASEKQKSPPRRHSSHAEQPVRLELGNGTDQNVYPKLIYDVPHFCSMETKYWGISPRSRSLLGVCYLETRAMAFYSKCIPFGKDNLFALELGHMCEHNPTAPCTH